MSKFLCLVVVLSLMSIGCWWMGDPESFVRRFGERIYFVSSSDQDSLSNEIEIIPTDYVAKIKMQGLFFETTTKVGHTQWLSLKLVCQDVILGDAIIFEPNNVQASYRNKVMPYQTTDTVQRKKHNSEITYEVSFGIDTNRTISIIESAPEFFEPNISIDLSRFVKVGSTYVSIEPVIAYPRNPERRRQE